MTTGTGTTCTTVVVQAVVVRVTNVLIRDEAPADGMGLFEAARLVGYPMSLPNLHCQSSTCITRR